MFSSTAILLSTTIVFAIDNSEQKDNLLRDLDTSIDSFIHCSHKESS